MRALPPFLVLVAMLAAVPACGPVPAASPTPAADAAEGRVVRKAGTTSIKGTVRAPVAAKARRLLAADAPVAGCEVFLAGPDGEPLAPAQRTATDAEGRYAFDKAPVGRHVVVAEARPGLKLMAIAQATAAVESCRLTLGSTLVTGAAIAAREGALPAFDQRAFDRTVFDVDRAYEGRPLPDLAAPAAALAAVAADAPGLPALAEALGFSLPASPTPSPTPSPQEARP